MTMNRKRQHHGKRHYPFAGQGYVRLGHKVVRAGIGISLIPIGTGLLNLSR
jgi:hypothetical protein